MIVWIVNYGTRGTRSGPPQAPFGRTTTADFQVKLAESFHCMLVADIPTFPFAKDTISVWKRTVFVSGLPPASEDDEEDGNIDADANLANIHSNNKDDNNDNDSDSDSDSDGSVDNLNLWAIIPPEEALPQTRAADCLKHLL